MNETMPGYQSNQSTWELDSRLNQDSTSIKMPESGAWLGLRLGALLGEAWIGHAAMKGLQKGVKTLPRTTLSKISK